MSEAKERAFDVEISTLDGAEYSYQQVFGPRSCADAHEIIADLKARGYTTPGGGVYTRHVPYHAMAFIGVEEADEIIEDEEEGEETT